MTYTPTPLDPNNIPIGGTGQPLNNGHLAAHSQIRDEIVINSNAIAGLPIQATGTTTVTILNGTNNSAPVTVTLPVGRFAAAPIVVAAAASSTGSWFVNLDLITAASFSVRGYANVNVGATSNIPVTWFATSPVP